MGNACCKRPTNELEREPLVSESTKFKSYSNSGHETDRRQLDQINNLERYLNDVYVNECLFNAKQEDVQFITTGIETLVHKFVDQILEDENLRIYIIEIPHTRLNYKISHAERGNSIINVGSIYEGSKNNYPDEFDFIWTTFTSTEIRLNSLWFRIKSLVEKRIYFLTVEKNMPLLYAPFNGPLSSRKKLHFDKYMERHGPAYMLRFIYRNDSGEEKYIHVDLVLAYKVVKSVNEPNWYGENIKSNVKPKSFRKEALSARDFLSVREQLSLTEIEVHFIRNVLSTKHLNVYRILKFLINGNENSESLERIESSGKSGENYKGYTSYMIKTMIIYHHDECTNSDLTIVGPCVLQILGEMCKYEDLFTFPRLIDRPLYRAPILCLLPELKSLVVRLKALQLAESSYDYEKVKMKSVSRQYLDGK